MTDERTIKKEKTCIDCSETFIGGRSATRCEVCRKKEKYKKTQEIVQRRKNGLPPKQLRYSVKIGQISGYQKAIKIIDDSHVLSRCVCGKEEVIYNHVFFRRTSCSCMSRVGKANKGKECAGVYKNIKGDGYRAEISVNKTNIYLGFYNKQEDAIAIRQRITELYIEAQKRVVEMMPVGNYRGAKHRNITGQTFGKSIAIAMNGTKKGSNLEWICICGCGNVFITTAINLLRGDTTSCGCEHKKQCIKNVTSDLIEDTKISSLNANLRINNTSGHKGVSWSNKSNKWYAYITFQGKMKSLGLHDFVDDAIKAREKAEEKYFKPIIEKYAEETSND